MESGSVPQNNEADPHSEEVEPVEVDAVEEDSGHDVGDEDAALKRAVLGSGQLATAAAEARARGDVDAATAADRAHAEAVEAEAEAREARDE